MGAELGWADLELLQRLCAAGTLSGAARALAVDQTTAARRLAALERRGGAALFTRIEGRLVATPPVAAIIDRLRAMSEQAAVSTAILRDATVEIHANVRVTSVGFILARALAPALGVFERDHPGIALELTADDRTLSFEHREMDVAVRLGASGEDAVRIKKLGDIPFRLCRPAGLLDGAGDAPVVRYGDDLKHLPEMQALDAARPRAKIALKSNRLDVLIEAAVALGAEIMLPAPVARADSRFIASEGAGLASRPVFLLTHPDRARIPSVAATASWIATTLKDWIRSS